MRVMEERLGEEPKLLEAPWEYVYSFVLVLIANVHHYNRGGSVLLRSLTIHPYFSIQSTRPRRENHLNQMEHRRIAIQGRFLHDFEMLVGPRNKVRPG